MKTVNIGDLKARLSAHIRLVKGGEEVLVCDRNKPVARIVPCHLTDRSQQEQRLIARGVLTPPALEETFFVSLMAGPTGGCLRQSHGAGAAAGTGRPVVRIAAFWDTSALVPLCVHQSITPRAIALYKLHDIVVWWATPVEIASSLARLVRLKQLDPGDWTTSRRLARRLIDSWSVIQPSDALRAKAAELVERHDLRAADSFQLAAALEWCEDTPRGRGFLTADLRLREAALLSGFDARPM